MYFGAIQISGERVGTSEAKDFCEALDAHKIKMLSLRECGISTKNFKKLMDSIAYCQSILHLNLNLCGIHCQDRVDILAASLNMNRSLTALLLHGNHFGTEGVCKIVRPLILHPRITCLDVGDCDLGDKALKQICELLPPDGDKPGLQELVLSGNPRITPKAWEKLSVSVSACSTLRSLYIDFNNVCETAGKMLVVCAAGHRSLNVLDMEACDLTECVGRLLLHLLQHYPTTLSHVLLEENDICDETKYAIRIALGESESDISSSDDDGRCELKSKAAKTCGKRTRRRTRKLEYCSSDEEEELVAVRDRCSRPRKKCVNSKQEVPSNSDQAILCVTRSGRGSRSTSRTEACCPPKQQVSSCSHPKRRVIVRPSLCKDESEVEETLAKFKICVEEVTTCSDNELLREKDDVDVSYEFKADETISACSDNQLVGKCQLQQEYVCKDGQEYLHIHGDCDGGTVKLRLRSRSRDPDKCEESGPCDRKTKPKHRLSLQPASVCKPVRECRTECPPVRECRTECPPVRECRTECPPRQQLNKKCRSRSRGVYGKPRTHRHRGSLGMTSGELWSDEDNDDAREERSKCGRGPWCGRGPLRMPNKPLERMADIQQNDDVDISSSPRSSVVRRLSSNSRLQYDGARSSVSPRPPGSPRTSVVPRRAAGTLKTALPANAEVTDQDVSDLKPDTTLKRTSTLSKITKQIKRRSEPILVSGRTSSVPGAKRTSDPLPKAVQPSKPKQPIVSENDSGGGETANKELVSDKKPSNQQQTLTPRSTERDRKESSRRSHDGTERSRDRRSQNREERSQVRRSQDSSDRSKDKRRRSRTLSRSRTREDERDAGLRSGSKNRGFLSNLKRFFVGENTSARGERRSVSTRREVNKLRGISRNRGQAGKSYKRRN